MTPENKTTLQMVINTLNTIEVKGRENMNHLLGCIMTLERMMAQKDEQEPKIEILPVDEEGAHAEHPAE